jgi:xylan 1,4-beta-xylosidase
MKVFRLMSLFLLTTGFIVFGQSPVLNTYKNPVIPGDHPDCTLTKIGNDYYTTGSSFNVTPTIYHSTDLVHWEAIARPVSASWSEFGDKPGGGCWGGQMVLYNGEFWDFFSKNNTMYFVKARKPAGPWSEPVMVKNPSTINYGLGYDNSIFIDDNNKWYLVVKNGKPNNGIVGLGNDGQPTGLVYNLNWLNPDPSFPYSWAEGPVMWKYNGYYFYSFARDLAGGQKVMRSKILTADQSSWEMLGDLFSEYNTQKDTSLFAIPNHASQAVVINDGTSWILHPLYAGGEWKGQGRQGLLNQVRYDVNNKPIADYPINTWFTAPKLPDSGIPWMVPKSDFFSTNTLNPEWSFLGYTEKNKLSLTERPGWLRLSPKSTDKENTLTKNDGEHNYSIITRLDFNPASSSDEAGLWIMRGDEKMYVKLVNSISADGKNVIVFSFEKNKYETVNKAGKKLWLKLVRVNHIISGFVSGNGTNWTQVGKAFDISQIDSYSDFSSFTGTRQGLYVKGSKNAWFDLYVYRDAFTPILAECPANQYGTSISVKENGISALDNIHNNDWALYAGVEFGNKDYKRFPKSISITASCNSAGGKAEVYIDSFNSKNKIAECSITSTGDWNSYKTFTASLLKPVSGRHDIYVIFKGAGTDKLYMFQWMTFVDKLNKTD